MKTSYIWIDGVMCEKKDVRISPKSAAIMEDIKPFVSPITREVITSRPALTEVAYNIFSWSIGNPSAIA